MTSAEYVLFRATALRIMSLVYFVRVLRVFMPEIAERLRASALKEVELLKRGLGA